jgi:hypothetical protein
MVIEMMSLFILTVFLAFFLGIIDRIFRPKTPREILRMRQKSGALSEEGWELLDQFKDQYGTPIAMIAPVLSELDKRLRFRIPELPTFIPTSLPTPLSNLPALPFASQRLAMLEQSGALEQGLQQQAQALQASGFRGGSLARAMMGARLGTMMNRERMLADLALQEYMMERQREEQTYQRQLQNYNFELHRHNLDLQRYQMELQRQLQQQQMSEGAAKERFNLLMGVRGGLQEQAVKGGAMTMENILQTQQLASQQMMGLMQGIGSLAGAYAQYRQNQEMLRTLQGWFQPQGQQGAPASSAPASSAPNVSAILSSAFRFFNPSRIVY